MKRQMLTRVSLAICVLLLIGLMPSVAQTSATDSDPPPWPLTWVEMAPMPTPRYVAGIAVSAQQTIYVIGGDNYTCVPLTTVEVYDPETNSWHTRAALPTGRWALGAATGEDGQIYAIGGLGGDPCGAGPIVLDTVEVYDHRPDEWTTRASMPTPRYLLGVVAGANGKIYAIGGEDQTGVLDIVEEYDPVSDTWTSKTNMPEPRAAFGSVSASNGKIYLIGGYGRNDLVLEFDPVADTWVEKAFMPTGRYDLGAAAVKNGLIFAVGGEADGPSKTVEAYDLTTDSWVPANSLASVRRGLAVAAVHKFVYAIGGWGIRADGLEGPVGLVEAAKTPNVNRPNR